MMKLSYVYALLPCLHPSGLSCSFLSAFSFLISFSYFPSLSPSCFIRSILRSRLDAGFVLQQCAGRNVRWGRNTIDQMLPTLDDPVRQ